MPFSRQLAGIFAALALIVAIPATPVAAVAPTGTPTILGPTAGQHVGATNPVLQWTTVSGAAMYHVEISTDAAFPSTSATLKFDTYALTLTPPDALAFNTWYWRVAGEDSGKVAGPYASSSFVIDQSTAPVTSTPADGAVLAYPSTPVIFSWAPVPGAVAYNIQVDDASDFVAAQNFTTKTTSFTLTDTQSITTDPANPKRWYWHVQAKFASNALSVWSATRYYTLSWDTKATLRSPANGSTLTDVVFQWDPIPGAKKYQIQVNPNADFQNNMAIDALVDSTRFAQPDVTMTLANGSYYWRVRPQDAGSTPNFGKWSDVWMFTRGWAPRPVLVSPPFNGVTIPEISQLRFDWTPASGAADAGWVDHGGSYQVQVSNDINFSPGSVVLDCYTNHTTWTPYDPIISGGEPGGCDLRGSLPVLSTPYYWHVRAVDFPKRITGEWSNDGPGDVWRFSYYPPIPTMVEPTGGTLVSTPVLKWNPVIGAEKYRITITKSDKSTTVGGTPTNTYALSYTPTQELVPTDGPFYWHVEMVDGKGTIGPYLDPSYWPSFNLSPPVGGSSLATLTPDQSYQDLRMPSMTWTPVNGAAYYKVWYSSTSLYTPLSGSLKLPYAGFTYAGLPLQQGTYTWYVEAYTSGDVRITYSTPPSSFHIGVPVGFPGQPNWYIQPEAYLSPRCDPYHDPVTDRCSPTLSDTPELDWTPDPYAAAYVIWIAPDAAFSTEYRRYVTIYHSFTARESFVDNQAGQSFYWYVQPCLDYLLTTCGPDPQTIFRRYAGSFRKSSPAPNGLYASAPPTPGTPATVIPDQITFHWNDYLNPIRALGYSGVVTSHASQEAKFYWFQAATAPDFANGTILETVQVEQLEHTPWQRTYPEGPIYWRVGAVDGSGNQLTLATGQVTKLSPKINLLLPGAGQTVSGVPTLSWTPQAYAAKYNVEVYKNGDLNWAPENRVLNQTTLAAAWAPTVDLAAGDYAWRVRRQDASDLAGPWSDGRVFHLAGSAPALTTPAQAYTFLNHNLSFGWTAVSRVAKYRFEASTTSSFTSLFESQQTVMNVWAPQKLYTDGAYFWRVRVLDASGNVTATSNYRSFTVMTVNTPSAPTGVTAVGGDRSATVRWTAPGSNGGSAITGYTVTSTPATTTCTTAATVLTCNFTGLTNGTSYTFSVRARNIAGLGAAGVSNAVVPNARLVRYSGADQFATAAAVSLNTFAANCNCVAYVANVNNWSDALAGAAAAAKKKGPMLFVNATGAIPAATATELTRLKPTTIYVLGGTGSIADTVLNLLKSYAGTVTRIGGVDRFEMTVNVSKAMWPLASGASCGCVVWISTAYNFPDALAAAAAAGRGTSTTLGPVLLVKATGAINTYTAAELRRLKPTRIIVLGGTGSVSDAVYNLLKAYAPWITRRGGADRYAAAASVSQYAWPTGTSPWKCNCVVYISGATDFNGALAGSAAAGKINGPLLLVGTSGLNTYTKNELTRLKPRQIIVVGNTTTVPAAVYDLLKPYPIG